MTESCVLCVLVFTSSLIVSTKENESNQSQSERIFLFARGKWIERIETLLFSPFMVAAAEENHPSPMRPVVVINKRKFVSGVCLRVRAVRVYELNCNYWRRRHTHTFQFLL